MTLETKRVALPLQYREEPALKCDGCGVEVTRDRMLAVGWYRGVMRIEDGRGSVKDEFVDDFCPDCQPKISRAKKQETDAIKAEKLVAQAETTGVT